jgi:hypothetical protein
VNDPTISTILELRVNTAEPERVRAPIHLNLIGPQFDRSQDLDVAIGPLMVVTMDDVPAGKGYVLTLSAGGGQTSCSGSSHFDIASGQKTTLDVALECQRPSVPSSPTRVDIEGGTNECPDIASVMSQGGAPVVGHPIELVAKADDPDHGPNPLSYTWLADSGFLDRAHESITAYTCTAPGLATVVLTVSDGDLPCDQFFGVKVDCAPEP